MNPTGYTKIILSVLMAAVVVISVLVPVVYTSSMTTTTVSNEGAGWAKYAYYDEVTDYDIDLSSDGSTLTMGAQSGTASDMIVYASDVFSVLYMGDSFQLVAPSGSSADLGASASVASSSGTVTVTDSSNSAVYSSDTVSWAYVPDSAGGFGFFDDVGANLGDFPLAAAGSFAGVNAYNSLVTLDAGLSLNSTVTDNVVTSVNWAVPENANIITASPLVAQTAIKSLGAVATPAYTDGDWGYNLTGSIATIVSYSGASGNIVIPSTVSDGTNTYTVEVLGTGSAQIFDNTSIAGSTLTLPNTVKTIKSMVFQNCQFTGSLVIPDSVTKIESNAFQNCGFNGTLTLSDSLTEISSYAFQNCQFTGSLVIPDSVTTLGYGTFGNSGFNGTLTLSDSLTIIPYSCFSGCSFIGQLVIPENITSIQGMAFSACNGFSNIVIIGSPSINSSNALAMTNISEILNLGDTEITAGYSGLPSNLEIRADVPLIGYIAPSSFSETVQNEGMEYDVAAYIPALMLVGLMLGVVGVVMTNRRA